MDVEVGSAYNNVVTTQVVDVQTSDLKNVAKTIASFAEDGWTIINAHEVSTPDPRGATRIYMIMDRDTYLENMG